MLIRHRVCRDKSTVSEDDQFPQPVDHMRILHNPLEVIESGQGTFHDDLRGTFLAYARQRRQGGHRLRVDVERVRL